MDGGGRGRGKGENTPARGSLRVAVPFPLGWNGGASVSPQGWGEGTATRKVSPKRLYTPPD